MWELVEREVENSMERWIFGMFLAVAAGQDLRKKQVDLWIYGLFGCFAFLLAIGRQLRGAAGFQWQEYIGGISIGLMLLGIGIISRGSIGMGDGLFFLVSGMILKLPENMLLLSYGILLCGLYSLGYLVWIHFRAEGIKHMRAQMIPFLPFLIPPGIWLLTAGI